MRTNKTISPNDKQLREQLQYLKLISILEHYQPEAKTAADTQLSHVDYLARLIDAEALSRQDRSTARRIKLARFPLIKTLEEFQWSWPRKINRLQVQNLFRLAFIEQNANVIFLGGVGLGKTHLCTALGHAVCLKGYSVLFASAIDIINTLGAAQSTGRLKSELKKYLRPAVLIIDELGYLPIDKNGADLLFQVISQRYERGSIIMTTNKPFKKWPEIFNNDSTLTSAVLDRLLHHAETVTLEGKSYRMKDQIES
jgi:DNA replication protein DnaC|tara:strand:+ start:2162 stop:2926 length:765 start_codon:yes stop_codon:yes gene_type:complete